MMLNSTILRDRRYYYYEDRIVVERRRILNCENNNNKKQIKLFINFIMKIFDTNIDSTKTITTTAVISNILNNHRHFHNYNCWRRRLFSTLLLSILMLTTNLQLINAKSSDHSIRRFDESVIRQQQQQKSSSSSSSCIIGRLRMCNPDEDCVENVVNTPEIKVIISNISNNSKNEKNNENDSSSSGYLSGISKSVVASLSTSSSSSSSYSERPGTCICRHPSQCKRTMDQSNQSSQASSRSDPYPNSQQQDHHRTTTNTNNISLIATILVSVSIVGSCCAFLIYYYGFRYGMIRHYARQFGLSNNTQIEHQLLNRVSVNGVDDDVELTI